MTRRLIGGIRSYQPGDIPDDYLARTSASVTGDYRGSLAEQVDHLSEATKTKLAYYDPEQDAWITDDDYAAVVNPDWLGADNVNDAPRGSALWTPRTQSYDVANPEDAYLPFLRALFERNIHNAFGEVREYHSGGEFHFDVFLPDFTVPWPDDFTSVDVPGDATNDRPELILGLTTGADHLGRTNLYSRAIAYDPLTDTVFRNLTERRTRRHVKPAADDDGRSANEAAAWWDTTIEQLNTVGNSLYQAIHDASQYEVDFDGIPFTPADFYTALGIPQNLADDAETELGGDAAESATVTAWGLHWSLAAALEDSFDGQTDGDAMGSHVGTANTILFQPPRAESRATNEWRLREREKEAGTQVTLSGEPLDAILEGREATAADRANEYQSMKDRVKSLLRDAKESEGADDDADAADAEAES